MRLKTEKLFLILTIMLLSCLSYSDLTAQQIQQNDKFQLIFICSDKDTAFDLSRLGLEQSFSNFQEAQKYKERINQILAAKGYPASAIDSSYVTDTTMVIYLYPGHKYQLHDLDFSLIEKNAMGPFEHYRVKKANQFITFYELKNIQESIAMYYENNGYPFAYSYLDSISFKDRDFSAILKVEKGIFYPIDSIRIMGGIKIKNSFFRHYLHIPYASGYDKSKLMRVDKRISELNFLSSVQPSDLTMLGSGAILNLYLRPKKSNQVNFLLGAMPNTSDKNRLLITGDVNLDLRNMLGCGERILFKWQQLQPKSPRLNLGYTHPYVFESDYSMDFLFELFKKDSNFIQVNAGIGCQYDFDASKSAKLFMQWQKNTLLSGAIDTNLIKSQKRLSDNSDYSTTSVGISYQWNNLNYKLNPQKGAEIELTGLVGTKKIRPNTDILNLKDNSFNYATLYDSLRLNNYQARLKMDAACYLKTGKSSTIKTSVRSGFYLSPEIFRNDLFQIGGYRLMRGFDEESIYATTYAVFTAEYRLLFGINSYLCFFSDYGLVRFKYNYMDDRRRFLGLGAGIVFETKAGLLNLSYAAGKRSDVGFNIRESSKIHFGYINYF